LSSLRGRDLGKTLRATYSRVSFSRSLADARNTYALKNGLVVRNLLTSSLGGFSPRAGEPSGGERRTLGVEDSMMLKETQKEAPGLLPRCMCVPTGPDRQVPRPDSTGQRAQCQLHRYPRADTVARLRMSKMTNETRAPQIPNIRNSADLSGRDISPTNELCPSSVFGDPILRARTGSYKGKNPLTGKPHPGRPARPHPSVPVRTRPFTDK
jgi:hypothetical protein